MFGTESKRRRLRVSGVSIRKAKEGRSVGEWWWTQWRSGDPRGGDSGWGEKGGGQLGVGAATCLMGLLNTARAPKKQESRYRETGVCYFSRTPNCPGFVSAHQSLRPLHRRRKPSSFFSLPPDSSSCSTCSKPPSLQAKTWRRKRKCFGWGQDM